MTDMKRISRQLTGGIVIMMIFGFVTGAAAETASRYDVLYSTDLEQMELEAGIMEVNLVEGYLIVGEQMVLLVDEDGLPPPVTRTTIFNRAGNQIPTEKLKVRQQVLIKGLAHESGQIIAVEITVLKQGRREGQQRKTNG